MKAAKSAGADLAEIRIDLLKESQRPKWPNLIAEKVLPVIVTNRAVWEGGNATTDENERIQSLVDAVTLGAEYVDVELEAAESFRDCCLSTGIVLDPTARLILSHHNFDRPLSADEINNVIADMRDANADICKIAMLATSALDNSVVYNTLKAAQSPTIMLAMGELGTPSRVLAPKYGGFLTFASVGAGRESAPGQVDTETLVNLYRFRNIKPDTPVYGVIGNPISHSMSPALHNASLKHADIDGVYLPLKVEDNVPGFILSMMQQGFEGFSVTMPGKLAAMRAMDEVDEIAAKIGAINTVVRDDSGNLKGYNTDWVAAISAVEEAIGDGGLVGKRVVCIGAGGAARGLAFGALERGASKICIVNRTEGKAVELAEELGDAANGMSLDAFNDVEGGAQFDVLMNTTSVGMHPDIDDTPVNSKLFKHGQVVFDAVYNPLETRLLKEAAAAGCVTVSGMEMFVRQAAEQFRLWFPDVETPVDVMRKVVVSRLSS